MMIVMVIFISLFVLATYVIIFGSMSELILFVVCFICFVLYCNIVGFIKIHINKRLRLNKIGGDVAMFSASKNSDWHQDIIEDMAKRLYEQDLQDYIDRTHKSYLEE